MEKVNNATFKVLFAMAVVVILVILYVAQEREEKLSIDVYELEQKNIDLQAQNKEIKREIDSLDLVISELHTQPAELIKYKIITKYEKEYNYIDSLNATNGFKFFSEWISKDDYYKNW